MTRKMHTALIQKLRSRVFLFLLVDISTPFGDGVVPGRWDKAAAEKRLFRLQRVFDRVGQLVGTGSPVSALDAS